MDMGCLLHLCDQQEKSTNMERETHTFRLSETPQAKRYRSIDQQHTARATAGAAEQRAAAIATAAPRTAAATTPPTTPAIGTPTVTIKDDDTYHMTYTDNHHCGAAPMLHARKPATIHQRGDPSPFSSSCSTSFSSCSSPSTSSFSPYYSSSSSLSWLPSSSTWSDWQSHSCCQNSSNNSAVNISNSPADVNFLSPTFSAAAALAAPSTANDSVVAADVAAAGGCGAVIVPVPEATPLPYFHLTKFLLPFGLQENQEFYSSHTQSNSYINRKGITKIGGGGGGPREEKQLEEEEEERKTTKTENNKRSCLRVSNEDTHKRDEKQGQAVTNAIVQSSEQDRFAEGLAVARNKQFRRDMLAAVKNRKEEAARAAFILRERFTGGIRTAEHIASPVLSLLRQWQQQQQEIHAVVACRSSGHNNPLMQRSTGRSIAIIQVRGINSKSGEEDVKNCRSVAGIVCWFDEKLNLLLQPARLLPCSSFTNDTHYQDGRNTLHQQQQKQQQQHYQQQHEEDDMFLSDQAPRCTNIGWLYIRSDQLISIQAAA